MRSLNIGTQRLFRAVTIAALAAFLSCGGLGVWSRQSKRAKPNATSSLRGRGLARFSKRRSRSIPQARKRGRLAHRRTIPGPYAKIASSISANKPCRISALLFATIATPVGIPADIVEARPGSTVNHLAEAGMRRQSTLALVAAAIFVIALCVTAPASAACPAGSQFFAYGGAGGCVKPGSSEVVVKCFSMGKVCPTGWSNEGPTETGSWCCPPPPAPKGTNCVWRGTAPFCAGECEVGETLKARSSRRTYGCLTGSKAFCCR
jgi:hypothetical protein